MKIPDGEPAFPCPEASIVRFGHPDGFLGMDIRTTIATKMMQGLLSNPGGPVQSSAECALGIYKLLSSRCCRV